LLLINFLYHPIMLRSSTKVNDEVWDFGEIELKPYDFSSDAAPVDDTPFDWGMGVPKKKRSLHL